MNTVGEGDFSAQEACHLLLQLPLYMASHDFVVLSLDGTRMVEDQLDEDRPATVMSSLDHYMQHPSSPSFEAMTLLHFTQQYSVRRAEGSEPEKRGKEVVVIVRPYCPPDPNGPKYEQYCHQKLMLHKSFRSVLQLMDGHDSYASVYAAYLRSGSIPACLEDDIHRLQQVSPLQDDEEHSEDQSRDVEEHQRPVDE